MSYGFENLRTLKVEPIKFERPSNLVAGDIVWILWTHYRHGDTARVATPTKIQKVYDDGNIIHQRGGFDDPDFENKLMIYMKAGPQDAGKASMGMGPGTTEQNGGFPMMRNVASPAQESNQNAQMGSAESQSANQGVY